MPVLLYDNFERRTREFTPLTRNEVGLYTCGPTVYDYQHIGNLRTYLFEDLLKRVLALNGFAVRHVMNITDVGHLTSDADTGEDKMEKVGGVRPAARRDRGARLCCRGWGREVSGAFKERAMKRPWFALAAMLAIGFGGQALAQPFPNKPVRILIGPAAGGPTDAMMRTYASKMTELWGQQVVVENRPGAGNTLAPTIAAKSTPDGYTLVYCGISDAIAPALYKKLSYDLLRDFAPLSLIGTTANLMVVNPSVPAKSVQEFIAYARANPGKIDYGSTGVGISTHLSMELFKTMTGVNLVHVPYKAFALALPDLLAGRISVMVSNLPGLVDTVRSGKLRALGVTTLKRSPRLPEVPTIHESGVPGFDLTVWYGVMAPAAVPAPILNKIHADTVKALGMADLRQRLEQQGIDPASPATRDEFAAFVKSETVKWAKVVRDANIPSQ